MLHADRWAARYGFLRELWAGRDRVLADPALEAALRGARALPAAFAALLAELLPTGAGASRSWLLAHDAGQGGRGRGGPSIVALDGFEDLLIEAPWQVAIVDLARLFVDAATLSRFAARAKGHLENRLETRAFRLLTALAEGIADHEGRVVVVSTPSEAAGGLGLTQFQDLVTQHFPRARVYAIATAPAATVVDCGEVTSDEEEDEEEDERGPVPLAYDNSLGEEPVYETYVAVVGVREVPRGVTIVELPAVAGPAQAPAPAPARARSEGPRGRGAGDEEGESLRAQLAQAKRQIELASIARHSLVEQLDAAQARIDALEDQLAGRHAAAGGAAPAQVREPPERADVEAAQLQSVQWELDQARGELRRLTVRPVEAAERVWAEAGARLAAVRGCLTAVVALIQKAGGSGPASELQDDLRTLLGRLQGALGVEDPADRDADAEGDVGT